MLYWSMKVQFYIIPSGSLPTCLREFSHLTGTVVGQTGNRGQWWLPVTMPSLAHVSDEGVHKRMGRFSESGKKKKD